MHDQYEHPEPQLAVPGRYLARRDQREYYPELPTGPYGYESDEGISRDGLVEYWRILSHYKRTWVLFVLASALLAFLATLPQTPIYQARSAYEVLGENDDFMNLRQASPIKTGSADFDTSEVQTQISLLESQTVLKHTIARLMGNYTGGKRPISLSRRIWRMFDRFFHLPSPSPVAAFEQELHEVAGSIMAKPDSQTRVIKVTVESMDAQLAADFLNTLINEFIDENVESRLGTNQKTSVWLGRQLDDMRRQLEKSEDALQAYVRSSGLIFTRDDKSSISEAKLQQIQMTLSAAQSDLITKQARYEAAQHSPPDALPEVLNDAGLRDTRLKLINLRKEQSDLNAQYTPEYLKVKRIRAQIAELEKAFEQDRNTILGRIKDEYTQAVRTEQLLQSAYFTQIKVVTGDGEKAIQYGILKRDVESNRQIYETMLQQLKQSTIASAMHASTVRVVDPADVPTTVYKPKKLVYVAVGTLLGVFLGATFIILREQTDRTIQKPGETAFYLNVPELGIIPTYELKMQSRRASLPSRSMGLTRENARSPNVGSIPNKVELVTWHKKNSVLAESFRSTLVSILFSAGSKARPHVLVLGSPGAGEGKSTVAANLAIAIAEVGIKVLLIDADMRRPRMDKIFNVSNERGLSDLLRDKTLLNGDFSLGGLIRESEIPGLFILPSGPGTSTAATNLLYGSRMPELMNYFRSQFDTVLIDTPPMLHIPDARVLGRLADGVILVFRAGKTTRDGGVAARKRFAEDGTKVLGTILNDWNPKTSAAGYYDSYGGYRGHYHLSSYSQN